MKTINKIFSVALALVFLATNANCGRWITPDPIGFMERDPKPTINIGESALIYPQQTSSLNLYQFNYNSALTYVDPDGKNPILIGILIGAVWGAAFTPYTANAPGPNDPTYPAITGDELLGGAVMGGLAGGAFGAMDSALAPRPQPSFCPVSRWGRSGLQPGDWVMKGEVSYPNYLFSGKYQPASWPGNNIPASYSSGVTYNVPPSSISWPTGINAWKGVIGQRIYNPTPQ
jgi:hypothetical protein